jgi:hypothetical protein
MPLKFPLHHYDVAGRLKPPLMLYCFLLFLCRGLLLLIISLSFREDSSRMMRLFYPSKNDFYWSLLPVLPALAVLALLSQRNRVWKNECMGLFKPMVTFFLVALLADISVQFGILWRIHFAFSMTHGMSILIGCIGLIYALKSRHMKDIVKDWVRVN